MQPEERIAPPPANTNGDGHGGHDDIPVDLPEVSARALVVLVVAAVVLFGALFLIGYVPHQNRQDQASKDAAEQLDAKPIVDVARPKPSSPTFDLVLPADVRANRSTAVYARTNGYLKQPADGIDIGSRVKQGQVIAEIAAPEVDAEIEQAKATVEQANVVVGRANNEFNFNKSTYERYVGLSESGGVTQQQLDEKKSQFNIATSSLKAANANLAAAQAALKRLTELQGFQKVVAPFDGTITARNYDAGALISATGNAPGKELFRIDDTDTLRLHVSVPQSSATDVKVGQEASLIVRNFPGRSFKGTVARTSGAVDPSTRTMRVEVDVPNEKGELFPGMYGQVRFKVQQAQPAPVVPTSALVFSADGMRVATVGGDSRVKFKKVTVGRDFGSEAEIADGLTADEQVVINPGERLADGIEVQVRSAEKKDGSAPQGKTPQAAAR